MTSAAEGWIDVLPKDWYLIPSKAAFAERREPNRANDVHLTPSQTHGVLPQAEYMAKTGNSVVQNIQGQDNMKHVEPDDFIIHLRSFQGGIERSRYSGKVSAAYTVLKPSDRVVPSYFRWLLKSDGYIQELRTTTNQLRDGQSIKFAHFAKVQLPCPPRSEQRAIADYLDRETARIDTLIEEQQRLIDLLHERRDAEADALLGSPVQARHTTVKRALRPLQRPAVGGLGVVTAFRDGVVTLRSNRREDGFTFSNTEHGYQEIRPGDLVFHALDGFAGAVGVSDSQGNATPVYHVCEATVGDDLAYVARLLRYLGRSGFLATQAPNVRERSVDFRNWAMFGRLPLALPPVGDQRRIAAHLDEQNAKTNTLIAESEQFVELARERRAVLIAAAVTGQIDVREMV
ncbi:MULTISPECIES: restriction endonuclease subunit S [Rhodococcus]|uniref:restriction endonuclease subunit S n=1 Tax=Rhodococcus TaxID=1827 RepID=UPI000976FC0B|nr:MULTISPECIES: restriction endonuclease subunit S [Rhodococcus]ARE38051.1 hypothetical protein A0W34_31690 [Rhodococcus sp. BH4]MBQ9056074.1 restriction endonuclease subunit S [Rhodococcus sp. (in: high G+C Gram-positive bacteria)]OMQ29483.1 hypothetical protein BK799_25825 [Rhodococcus sp. D-1]QXC46392.1 restriction endonuclease subunit S [Rhodococcus qingshengii]